MSAISVLLQTVRGRRQDYAGPPVPRAEPRSLPAVAEPVRIESAADAGDMRFTRIMEAFNVDRHELEQDYPKVLLDAQTTCMWCRSKRRCFRELEAGTAARNAEHFCPNADILMIFANNSGDTAAG